jgi:hypothetical protein
MLIHQSAKIEVDARKPAGKRHQQDAHKRKSGDRSE